MVAQVKHAQRLSLDALEALAVEIAHPRSEGDKIGVVAVKRRAGRGTVTPRLVVMTEASLRRLLNYRQPETKTTPGS